MNIKSDQKLSKLTLWFDPCCLICWRDTICREYLSSLVDIIHTPKHEILKSGNLQPVCKNPELNQ